MKEQVLKQSQVFWKGLEQADTAAMRSVCDDKCFFVHIGGNCDLDREMDAFEKKVFQPTEIVLHSQEARAFGDVAIVISDVDLASIPSNIEKEKWHMAKKQTAGRDRLGNLAPQFAALNDDVLFGEVWAREEQLSARDRSMITIAALFSAGLYPQLKSHLILGKEHGITREEAVEIVTQLAFYCGWPKAWSTFPMIAEVWPDEE